MYKLIGGGIAIAVAFFFGTLWAMDRFSSPAEPQKPVVAEKPPLPPATRSSVIVAPVSIALPAIRQAMEQAAPRNLTGKPDTQLGKWMAKAEVGYTLDREPLTLTGRADGLTVATTLNGSLRVSGKAAEQLSNITGALAGLLGEQTGRTTKDASGRVLDQRADIKGNVAVTSRPTITTNWRIEPNLNAQVNISDANIQLAGLKLNGAKEVKPLVDRAVSEQMSVLQNRLRNDAFIENAARKEWAKMCRSISLGAGDAGRPALFLEMRPTRAFAAQPIVDANGVTLTLGIQADTRIVAQETKPDCPFPARLELVAPMDRGRFAIGLPIDVPFPEINRLLDAQIKGRTFPEEKNAAVKVTVQRATVTATGDRLLVSLLVKGVEQKSWLGLGTEATVHVSGKPVLDQTQQTLRLEDIQLAVESDAAFGLLGAAAKAAMPQLQAALSKNTVVDLRPALADARRSIDKALTDFRQQADGVKADAAITGLRLVGIEFDSRIVRVTAEADGVARVAVTKLPQK